MKTTAFTEKHIELGAKMVPFAGYNMPWLLPSKRMVDPDFLF